MRKYKVHTKHGIFDVQCDDIECLESVAEMCEEPLFLYRDKEVCAIFKDWIALIECLDSSV